MLGLRVDTPRLLRAVVFMFAGYIAAPLAALAPRDLTNGLLAHDAGSALAAALLAPVRASLFATTRSLEAVLELASLLVQTAITVALLVMVNPWFTFLSLCAVVPVLLERVAQSAAEGARERTAQRPRLSKHLVELATTGAIRELRLFGAEPASKAFPISPSLPVTRILCIPVPIRGSLRCRRQDT